MSSSVVSHGSSSDEDTPTWPIPSVQGSVYAHPSPGTGYLLQHAKDIIPPTTKKRRRKEVHYLSYPPIHSPSVDPQSKFDATDNKHIKIETDASKSTCSTTQQDLTSHYQSTEYLIPSHHPNIHFPEKITSTSFKPVVGPKSKPAGAAHPTATFPIAIASSVKGKPDYLQGCSSSSDDDDDDS